jgi:uncharacterized protein (TIGR03437 family)
VGLRFFAVLVICVGAVRAQSGIITTIAGGARGFSGDGGPAVGTRFAFSELVNPCDPARFEQPVQMALDREGNLYIADAGNHRIRQIAPDGIVKTVAGSGLPPATNDRCEAVSSVADGAAATAARLFNPTSVALHPSGDLIIADQQNNRIRRVDTKGNIATIAGSGSHNLYAPNIPATSSPMDWPSSVAVDANGVIYFAEIHSHRVGRIGADGRITTVAGTGFPGFSNDGIPAVTARLSFPTAIAIDRSGNLYIAEARNHRIRKVTPDGRITTVAGTGVAGDSDELLNTPMDVKVDNAGRLYIADTLNHKVKRVEASGRMSTVAGDGSPGRGDDNVPAVNSSLRFPAGLALDENGDLYIADWQNYLIRKVAFGPSITRGGVVHAATFAATPLSPGTIFTILGTNMATFTRQADSVPIPPGMADVSVEVNGAPVPLFYVSPTQINAQLPGDLAPGTAKVRVRSGTAVSLEASLPVASSSPGVFQLDAAGRAAALNQDSSLNAPANGELAGNVITLYLTGLGIVSPEVRAGDPAPLDIFAIPSQPVSATVAGSPAQVLFAGLTPGSVGLGQINIRIPSATIAGPAVPVTIRVGSQTSNTVTISVR